MTIAPSLREAPARASRTASRLNASGIVLLIALCAALALRPSPASAAAGESQARSVQAGAIAAGAYTSCVLRGNGHVGCWGAGDHGQLGNGSNAGDNSGALATSNLDDATQLAFGGIHGCAIRTDRRVACWGGNDRGQIGDGQTGAANDHTTPFTVPGIDDATSVTTMNSGTCVLRATGTVACWGDNDGGEVGQPINSTSLPDSAFVPTPQQVPGLSEVVAIDAGWWHVCAIKRDGTVWCWGFNGDGQLGQPIDNTSPSTLRFPTPVQVPGVSDAIGVSGGTYQTCILRQAGVVDCMGSDGAGEAGAGTVTGVSSPALRRVVGLDDARVVQVTVGMQVGCALLEDGAVRCWGSDVTGSLGNDAALASSATPVPVHDLTASAISADRHTVCAISRHRSVSCWGDDSWSNLGNGGDFEGNSPGVAGVVEVSSPYGQVAAPVPSVALAGSTIDGAELTATVQVRNDGPDSAAPVIQLATDRRLELGALPDDVDAATDHGATWRPGTIAAGATATLRLRVTAVGAGSATLRAVIVGSDALDPRRPLGRGPLVPAQRASAAVEIRAAGASQATSTADTAPTPTGTPAPAPPRLAALDARALIALARPSSCHRVGTPLRIRITTPAGATVQRVAVGRRGRTPVPLVGAQPGTLRLPPAIVRTVEGRPGTSRKLTVAVALTDGRSATRTLTVRTCR